MNSIAVSFRLRAALSLGAVTRAAVALQSPAHAAVFGPPESDTEIGQASGAAPASGVAAPIDDAEVSPAACCQLDFNCDGHIDILDWPTFAVSYNILICSDPLMPANCNADADHDGLVDDNDYVLFVVAYFLYFCP